MKNGILIISAVILSTTLAAKAQIAQGGVYTLEQAVIASGGTSTDATGNIYTLDGTAGEPIAGTTSSAGAFSLKGGFLTSPSFVPTAAGVSISGRVITSDGSGLMNARVTLTDSLGNGRTILTKKMGAFRFDDVMAGEIYVISINSRHYTFQPQVISVTENLSEVNFTAQGAIVLTQ